MTQSVLDGPRGFPIGLIMAYMGVAALLIELLARAWKALKSFLERSKL